MAEKILMQLEVITNSLILSQLRLLEIQNINENIDFPVSN